MRIALTFLLMLTLACSPTIATAEFSCESLPPKAAATPSATTQPAGELTFPQEGGEIRVFAAASLTDAFNEIASDIMEAHPHVHIVVQTAGSQTLVTQLEEGAPADVLATANMSTMDRAADMGLIEGQPVMFTGNRLVIVTPSDNRAGVSGIDDLARDGLRVVIANAEVPAGAYTAQALCAYDGMDAAPEAFLENVNANIVSEEPDVRHVLAKVQLGEADAGVVYASDAAASKLAGVELHIIEFPAGVPTRADYPIAAVHGGDSDLAAAFITWVLSEDGQAVLRKYGFG